MSSKVKTTHGPWKDKMDLPPANLGDSSFLPKPPKGSHLKVHSSKKSSSKKSGKGKGVSKSTPSKSSGGSTKSK